MKTPLDKLNKAIADFEAVAEQLGYETIILHYKRVDTRYTTGVDVAMCPDGFKKCIERLIQHTPAYADVVQGLQTSNDLFNQKRV